MLTEQREREENLRLVAEREQDREQMRKIERQALADRDAGIQFTCFTGTKILALLVQILTEAGRDAERLREREREREREAERGRERAERELRWREMVC